MTANRPLWFVALPVALALSGLSALDAARNALTDLNPILAAKLPGSEAADVDILSLSLGQPEKLPAREKVFATARGRLRDEPLDPAALNIMAYAADHTGRTGAAVPYADVATQVSKRMAFSQLAMTVASLQRNDVTGTIDRFDAVLRSRPAASALFFPYLKQALVEPDIRQAIADLAATDSPWVMDFLGVASSDAKFVGLAAETMLLTGLRLPANDREIYAGPMLSRAFEGKHYVASRRLVRLIPRGTPAMFASPALTPLSLDAKYGLAAWQLSSTSTGSASATGGDAPAVSFYATGGAHTVLASKHLLLGPGRYALVQDLESGSSPVAGTEAVWRVTCIVGAEIWRSDNLLARAPAKRLGPFAVPRGCPAQRLDLEVDVAFGLPSIDLTLRSIDFAKAPRPTA